MKFSIIIPVYNVEKYLKKCVESLINQTFKDFEIILVDDGSPDNCPTICDDYAKNNSFIKVVHKKNGGLSDARNLGIKTATGEFLIFIDSDDYINSSKFLEKINDKLETDNLDMIIYGYKKYFEKSKKVIEKKAFNHDKNKKLIDELIENSYFKACAWDKVIKRKIIVDNNLYFPLGKLGEDIEWCAELLKVINYEKIAVISENFYVYRQRKGSICKNLKGLDFEAIMDMIDKEKMIECNSKIGKIVNSYLANEYAIRLGRISCKEVKEVSKETKDRFFKNKDLLNYDISNHVKKINKIIKFLGIKNTSKLLGFYIDIKKLKG